MGIRRTTALSWMSARVYGWRMRGMYEQVGASHPYWFLGYTMSL